jgi:glucose-1-phosphate thymidylyltransferase
VCAILGDNVYFDHLGDTIRSFKDGAHLFLKEVPDAKRFGVATMDGERITSIEEKPLEPKSNMAVTGCYVYDKHCFDVIRNLKPSARGELEITDVSDWYVKQGTATATILQKPWIDAGTFESLFKATELVRKERLGTIIAEAMTHKNTKNMKETTSRVTHSH